MHRYLIPLILLCLSALYFSSCNIDGNNEPQPDPTAWDQTFGTDGLITTQFPSGQSQIQKILIDSNDRIYAFGWNYPESGSTQLAMARYTSEGILDTTFGTNGLVTDDFNGNGFEPTDAEFDLDGKIVVTGFTGIEGINPVVARYETDGSIDTTFGTNGYFDLEFHSVLGTTGYTTERAFGVVARAVDNALYVAGTTNRENGSSEYSGFTLLLSATAGDLNTAWSSDGIAVDLFGSTGSEDLVFDVALDDAGDNTSNLPIVGGAAYNGTDYDFLLAKYSSVGTIAATFGTNGAVKTDFGADDYILKLHTYDDYKVLAAGFTGSETTGANYDIALARYNADGSPDTTFGTNGKTTFTYGNEESLSKTRKTADMTVDSSGRIYFAGAGGSDTLTLARFNADGTIDTTFGVSGLSSIPTSSGTIKAVGIQSTGKIVVGGQVGSNNDRHFHLARFRPTNN